MLRSILLIAGLLAVLVGYIELRVPVPVSAQGGDAVYRSLRLQIPLAREYMEPQGPQDAAWDLLSTMMQTSSITYENVMSAEVTVGEDGDAVLIHLTGSFMAPDASTCQVRLVRGTTEIQVVHFGIEDLAFRFDATFVDVPPVGTHAYTVQMRRTSSNVSHQCVAEAGGDTSPPVPAPSMLVQSYYGGSVP